MPRAPREAGLDAQRFLLTYSSCEGVQFSAKRIAESIYAKTPTPEYVEVARELHEDGTPHYHAFISFPSRFRGTMRAFDFEGKHCNVRTVARGKQHVQRSRQYIRKPGHDQEGWFHQLGVPPPFSEEDDGNAWSIALQCSSSAEFLEVIKRRQPREYILRYHDLVAFAQFHFNAPSDYESPYDCESFVVPTEVNEWIAEVFGEVCLTPRNRDAPFLINCEQDTDFLWD